MWRTCALSRLLSPRDARCSLYFTIVPLARSRIPVGILRPTKDLGVVLGMPVSVAGRLNFGSS